MNIKLQILLTTVSVLAVVGVIEGQDGKTDFTLTGKVFENGSTTQIVPVVKIKAMSKYGKTFETVSRVDGSYELKLSFGLYNFEFTRDCFKKTIVRDYENISNTTPILNANLERGNCNDCGWNICEERLFALIGTIRDQYDATIPKARVRVSGKTNSGHVLTLNMVADDEGAYFFELPEGKYGIAASASGHKSMKPKKITIGLKPTYELEIKLVARPTPII